MNKAIIWDLLGTLGGDSSTLIKDFTFFDETVPALKMAQDNGFLNIIVTNQSHIAHGRFTISDFEIEMERLKQELKQQTISIEKVYVCPHKRKDNCSCKKPLPALLYQAEDEYDLNLEDCYIVGDSLKNDMQMAINNGVKGILVFKEEREKNLGEESFTLTEDMPYLVAKDGLNAINIITSLGDSPVEKNELIINKGERHV